ncbi:hypothetical protein Tco_0392612 [Tanacetum coccineum]
MNPQEKLQVAGHDDKWVPFSKRVKISSTNIRLETIVPQKKDTFQVVIDLIKKFTCFKAFTISADVLEIFMHQFWTILDICPRVEGVDFRDVPDDDIVLTFLIDLGYKGLLYKHTNMFMNHMHHPWRTMATIINKCLSGKTTSKDYQEYRLPIPETMLTEAIKQSESYQIFIKYSTGQIRPKKSRGKGSHRKKTADDSQETVDVSEESKPKPEPAKKKTSSKRRVKNKVTLSANDNIISDDPDDVLELSKFISQTEAEEAKATRKVHVTHARIVTEYVPESAKKKSGGRIFECSHSRHYEYSKVVDIMQALKESKKISRRQPGIGGSNEGTGSKAGVPDESTVVSDTSSEGTDIKLGVPDEEKDITEEKDDKDGDVDDEGDDHINDTQDTDDEDVKTESDEEDIYKYKIRVRKDEDEEMINTEVDDSDKGDEEVTDARKVDAEKTSEVKDDTKKTELPQSSSSLSVSLVPTPVHESPLTATATTLPLLSVTTTPFVSQQITTTIPTQPITTDAPTITIIVPESNALIAVELRVEKDVAELKTVNHFTEALTILKSQVPSIIDNYLGSKVRDVFQKELKTHTADLIQKYSLQQFSESSKKQTPTVDLEQGSEKSASEIL